MVFHEFDLTTDKFDVVIGQNFFDDGDSMYMQIRLSVAQINFFVEKLIEVKDEILDGYKFLEDEE